MYNVQCLSAPTGPPDWLHKEPEDIVHCTLYIVGGPIVDSLTSHMRYIKDLPHPQIKIGLYSWNSKYIVKIEAGPYEQTYKIAEFDVSDPDEVEAMLSESFIASVLTRFGEMDRDWSEAISASSDE